MAKEHSWIFISRLFLWIQEIRGKFNINQFANNKLHIFNI